MKKYCRNIFFSLVWVLVFTGCSREEEAVTPLSEETCDTMATVQFVPSCGLLLVLENNQKLVPVNTTVTINPVGTPLYKIDGFAVQEEQKVIVGFKTSTVKAEPSACNQSGYHTNKSVNITCIVTLEN
jgi:hypothetical protein